MHTHPLPPPIVKHISPEQLGSPPALIACALCADYVLDKANPAASKPILLLSFWLTDGDCYLDLAYAVGRDESVQLVEGTCDDTLQCPQVECCKADTRFSEHVVAVDRKLMTAPEYATMRGRVSSYLTEAAAWWYTRHGRGEQPPQQAVPATLTWARRGNERNN